MPSVVMQDAVVLNVASPAADVSLSTLQMTFFDA
jgi:hypothetical protein